MFEPLPVKKDTPEQVQELLASLESSAVLANKDGKARKTQYTVQASNGPITVDSWKFKEFDYSKNIQLPCNARGIFTANGAIVARGYDKFFNVNEVADTKLEKLRAGHGPYEVSTKENGCIIFVSGLEDGTLVVCSKHSTGSLEGNTSKHFERGQAEIYAQVERMGKLATELATVLFELNLTAVAELCDDDFEEHILEYPKEMAGLYLHGLNSNTRELSTYPMDLVGEFAHEWGFRQVDYKKFENFEDLWDFLELIGKKGVYDGREIEGFVIRNKENGHDFFFKYKFDEPYHLYRQFREVTNKLIDDEVKQNIFQIVMRVRQHQHIILRYLEFVEKLFEENPEMKENYKKSLGIIKVRKLFLHEMGIGESEGMQLIGLDDDLKLSERFSQLLSQTTFKYFVVPIATIGCGKTTTFKILTELFPEWGHVQNDDVLKAKDFPIKCLETLFALPLVFVDRCNHMSREREKLFSDLTRLRSDYLLPSVGIRYVGVNFVKNASSEELRKITEERVLARGDNHQSTKAASNPEVVKKVMDAFIARFQSPQLTTEDKGGIVRVGADYLRPDSEFEIIINAEVEENSSLKNAKLIWRELAKRFEEVEQKEPTEEEWAAAYERALAYEPTFTKMMAQTQKAARKAMYFGVHVDTNVVDFLDTIVSEDPTWKKLKEDDRVQQKFHVTLGHMAAQRDSQASKEIWNDLGRKFEVVKMRKDAEPDTDVDVEHYCNVAVKRIVIVENKLIALDVELPTYFKKEEEHAEREPLKAINKHLHITIGTADNSIKPMMSNVYLTELHTRYPAVEDGEYELSGAKAKVWKTEKVYEKQAVFIHFA